MSPKKDKRGNTFTVTGMFTFSVKRNHVIAFTAIVLLCLSLVLDDSELNDLVQFCGKLLVPQN